MKRVKPVIVGAFALVLAACQTTSEDIGNGPLSEMPDVTQKGYQYYLIKLNEVQRTNGAFAYDAKGGGYAWVTRFDQDGINVAIEDALKVCHERDPRRTCKIFDINGRIVWKGITDSLKAELQKPVEGQMDAAVYFYDDKEYEISDRQKRAFNDYMNFQVTRPQSAFYVSENEVSVGKSFKTHDTNEGYQLVRREALQNCLVSSGNRKCFLFAVNGEPINEEARRAIYGD